MLKVDNVYIQYGEKELGPYNIDLASNQIVCIIGSSGAGKTSLIKAITNNVELKSGEILFNNKVLEKKDYVYITQIGTLFNHLTIRENLMLTVELTGINAVLKSLNLSEHLLDEYPFNLSGGERQRFDLVRAILSKVKLVILDEAFNALDSKTKDDIYDFLLDIQKQYQILILMVTHDIQEAVILADMILLIEDGTVAFNGTAKELLDTKDSAVKKLVNPRKINMLKGYYADSN